jgi:hypothetical protein
MRTKAMEIGSELNSTGINVKQDFHVSDRNLDD